MNVGPLELVVLVILVLLAFGGRRLPEAGRAVGGGIRNLIDGVRGIHPEEESTPELEDKSPAKPPKAS